jgi:P-type E1-E2 ATPase
VIEKFYRNGTNVRMISGDNIHTAVAVALECGIITKEEEGEKQHIVMEGEQFREMVGGTRKIVD